jgi:ribulose-phosphate 3-epimerase
MMMNNKALFAPSILSANFGRLAEELKVAEKAGAEWIHVDVMDGHFVPNITIGPVVVEWARKYTSLPLDVHLMIEDPCDFAEAFVNAGADFITVHIEAMVSRRMRRKCPKGWALRGALPLATRRANVLFDRIHKMGRKCGIVLNPATPACAVKGVIDRADMAMAMTVWPGFGGQKFMAEVLPKVAELREILGRAKRLEIDGGVSPDTVAQIARAGADTFVAGSAFYGAKNPAAALAWMRGTLTSYQ